MKMDLIQIYELALAGLKVRYRKTYVGVIWVVMNPVILLLAQGFVFSKILHIQLSQYFLYLVSGLLPWIFISQTLEMGTAQVKAQGTTIKSFLLKPYQMVAALALENIVNFFASQVLILTPILLLNNKSLMVVILWLLNTIPLFLGAFSFAFIFGTLNILFRDLKYILSFLLSIFYFITPIFYRSELIPIQYRWLLVFNPFHILLSPFQVVSDEVNYFRWLESFTWACLVSILLLFLSIIIWKKVKNLFYINL